ncbi:MAG: 30S ribosomal protein S4 [Candidatus Shikimatogenerans sp. Tder]|uniref:Small ribosomal subunit protein uS4 n=1 Tax=Candidatus Shikimatogenerans sp. Tder TaxID=3158566 RepID=A0AAU7QRX4_9FLAO
MIKYLGPKNKISRKFNYYIYNKIIKRNKKLGYIKKRKYTNYSQYYYQLLEKQKIKYIYGLSEKQLKNFILNKKYKKKNLIINCELRLDNMLYRFGYSNTRRQARQYINHKHILLNNKIFNIPSYQMKINDKITFKKKKLKNIINFINNIKKNNQYNNCGIYSENYTSVTLKSIPKIKNILEKINIKLIIEYYYK